MEMVEEVHRLLRLRGEEKKDNWYVNNNRNYILLSDFRAYLLKWQDEPFKSAGEKVPGLMKKGWGVSVDLATYVEFARKYPDGWILQNWSDNNTVYYVQREFFDYASCAYEQKNGEWERVISVRDLKPLVPIN